MLIIGKINTGGSLEEAENLGKIIPVFLEGVFGPFSTGRYPGLTREVGPSIRMTADSDQLLGDPLGGQNQIDSAGFNGTVRHASVFGRFFILGKGDAALGLNCPEPLRT